MNDFSVGIPSREHSQAPCALCDKPPVRIVRIASTPHSPLCVEHFDRLAHLMRVQVITYLEHEAHREPTDA